MLFGFFSALLENCKHKAVTRRFSFLVPVISEFIFSYFSVQQWLEFKSCTCLLLRGIQGRVHSVFPWLLVYIFSLALLSVLPLAFLCRGTLAYCVWRTQRLCRPSSCSGWALGYLKDPCLQPAREIPSLVWTEQSLWALFQP